MGKISKGYYDTYSGKIRTYTKQTINWFRTGRTAGFYEEQVFQMEGIMETIEVETKRSKILLRTYMDKAEFFGDDGNRIFDRDITPFHWDGNVDTEIIPPRPRVQAPMPKSASDDDIEMLDLPF